jgi:hypothetical protein
MIFRKKNYTISEKQCFDAGIAMAIVSILAGLFSHRPGFQFLTLGILVINMLAPKFYYPFAIVWFGLSGLLGSITSKIILGLVFYFVVTPVGLIRRFYRNDRLNLTRFKKDKLSVFKVRDHKYISSDLKNMF